MSDNNPVEVADRVVVGIEYTLTVEGEVLDSSEEDGPLEYLQGFHNIIPGLEKELAGMKVGESKSVVVQPEDGYGEYDEDALMDVPRSEFPESIPLEEGVELHVTDEDGDELLTTIVEVGDETVILDANHPLAGKELNFEVKVISLREASEEEISHGHVHSGGHDH
ncbi:MAG: peptidylprolyl isomerase [Anaerolineae bacterium]|nr:peptidylprolyl isomerase [Anaerolineae bacterium]